jgi:prepilin-type N-terminal cleavage/methylation domain-containing protein
MTSLTGNKKGFTLIEVMVTTAVLAFGIVSIFQALFIILGAFSYVSHYLDVVSVADEKVWEARDALIRSGPQAALAPQGKFDAGGKLYDWTLAAHVSESAQMQNSTATVYRLDLSTRWKEGRRDYRIERSSYVIYESGNETK